LNGGTSIQADVIASRSWMRFYRAARADGRIVERRTEQDAGRIWKAREIITPKGTPNRGESGEAC